MASIFRQIGLTFVVVIVCVALHEVGHLVAAKALGYEAVIRMNSVSLVGGATNWRDDVIVDAAGPLVTLLFALVGLALSNRENALGATMVFAALMMRVLAAVISLNMPNDEARISELLGLGTWTLPAIAVALLAIIMGLSARRSGVGSAWLRGAWIGASLGFVVVVFGEPYLPAITV
tara:strand:- start:65 stop:595 length:531 start_codon:yes stop_codon:yes gene_type:complete